VSDRAYDIVLYGATGFTGQLTAEYLSGRLPEGARWALAGRNLNKLAAVRDHLGVDVPLVAADSSDPGSLRSLAESTRVLVTTVGPYLRYGEGLVAACAAAGTGYLDLTGEPEFVDRMYLTYQPQAVSSGARLIHACGFDSIPYDLGVLWLVAQLPADAPIAVRGFIRAGGTFSGGTFHSAVGAMSRLRQAASAARERARVERAARPLAVGRRVRNATGAPYREPLVGGWVVPAPTIDPQIVLRSARALPEYGPDFSYAHYLATVKTATTAQLIGGVGAAVALAQLPPTRNLLLRTVRTPGEGPSAEQRARSWFKLTLQASTPTLTRVATVSGGDPGYGETAKMLSEAALCLAFDEVPTDGGQLTPAVALGRPLLKRLIDAGIRFEVVS
jgi:short subunit dehydrogenase-like uncharacterized protein